MSQFSVVAIVLSVLGCLLLLTIIIILVLYVIVRTTKLLPVYWKRNMRSGIGKLCVVHAQTKLSKFVFKLQIMHSIRLLTLTLGLSLVLWILASTTTRPGLPQLQSLQHNLRYFESASHLCQPKEIHFAPCHVNILQSWSASPLEYYSSMEYTEVVDISQDMTSVSFMKVVYY